MKVCNKTDCHLVGMEQPLSAFTSNRPECNICRNVRRALRRIEDPRIRQRERDYGLLSRYGLTRDDFNRMFESQGSCCANPGCQTTEAGTNDWHVDHDHATGKIRGILCHGCNLALGLLKDNPARINGLALYAGQTSLFG